ncbi:MAG TPA: sugar phosphate nucleotidyltransferase [Candidatus Nanoarchaeia archaeon]|nr:sugar phosphate nucleotidyltransferase [Candidatus Nanoarchaeia archaeon]
MQVIVLCGGKGTRLSEYTEEIPKPLINVGNKPILWHLVQMYKRFGHKDFVFCLGYKGEKIREYFKNEKKIEIQFIDTGAETNKAERIQKVKHLIKDDNFFVTYGDDLSDVDLKKLLEFHKKNKKTVTLTAVNLESPFGILELNKKSEVIGFKEKPKLEHFMNGGFYVFNKKIFKYMKKGYDLERDVLRDLAKSKQIAAFRHKGYWKSMNTLKDVIELNEIYNKGEMKWLK